jgi:protein-disulfide isomerase
VKPGIVRRYVDAGMVRFVWHDFAWIGAESRQAAQAARCAGRQGRFWQYHDHLFANQRGENQGHFAPANLRAFAGAVGLDAGQFGACLEQAPDTAAIQQDLQEGRQRGVNATPAFFVNGQRLAGARSIDAFALAIDAELKKLGQ